MTHAIVSHKLNLDRKSCWQSLIVKRTKKTYINLVCVRTMQGTWHVAIRQKQRPCYKKISSFFFSFFCFFIYYIMALTNISLDVRSGGVNCSLHGNIHGQHVVTLSLDHESAEFWRSRYIYRIVSLWMDIIPVKHWPHLACNSKIKQHTTICLEKQMHAFAYMTWHERELYS